MKLVLATLAAATLALSPLTANAQARTDGNELAPLTIATNPTGEIAAIDLVHIDGERANVLVWGPGLLPTACLAPCGVFGGGGQYGVTVAAGEAAWSAGFVLPTFRLPARVMLRPPSLGRGIGAGILLGFGVPTTGAGVGMALTALALAGSGSGGSSIAVVFGAMIALPLLVAGVPMVVGGVYLSRAASPAAIVELASPTTPRPSAFFEVPLWTVRF